MTQLGDHNGKIKTVENYSYYRGVCSCGFETQPAKDFRDADRELHEHITEGNSTGDEGGMAL